MKKVQSQNDDEDDKKFTKLPGKIRAQKSSSNQCSQSLIDQINQPFENSQDLPERGLQELQELNKGIIQLQKKKKKRQLIKLLKKNDEQFYEKLSLLQTFNQYNQNNLVERRDCKKVLVIGKISSGKTSLISYLCNTYLTKQQYKRLSQIKQVKEDKENKLIYFDSPPLLKDLDIFQENFLKKIYEMDSIIVVSDRGFQVIIKFIQVLDKIKHPSFFLVRTKCDILDSNYLKQIKKREEQNIQQMLGVKKTIIYFSTKNQNFQEGKKYLKDILMSNNLNQDIIQDDSSSTTEKLKKQSQPIYRKNFSQELDKFIKKSNILQNKMMIDKIKKTNTSMKGNYTPEIIYKNSKKLKKMKILNFPFDRICRIVTFDDNDQEIGHGTGINFIGSFVLTSLHIFVKMKKSENPNLEYQPIVPMQIVSPKKVKVYMGQNGQLKKHMIHQVLDMSYPEQFKKQKLCTYDYAVLRIDGNGQDQFEKQEILFQVPLLDDLRREVDIIGYDYNENLKEKNEWKRKTSLQQQIKQTSKEVDQMHWMFGCRTDFFDIQEDIMLYKIPTDAGKSGAPLMINQLGGEYRIVGMHTGCNDKQINFALRMNRSLIEAIFRRMISMDAEWIRRTNIQGINQTADETFHLREKFNNKLKDYMNTMKKQENYDKKITPHQIKIDKDHPQRENLIVTMDQGKLFSYPQYILQYKKKSIINQSEEQKSICQDQLEKKRNN